MLKMTACKSYLKFSIEAGHNHELKKKQFKAKSRKTFFDYQITACRQMIVTLFRTNSLTSFLLVQILRTYINHCRFGVPKQMPFGRRKLIFSLFMTQKLLQEEASNYQTSSIF